MHRRDAAPCGRNLLQWFTFFWAVRFAGFMLREERGGEGGLLLKGEEATCILGHTVR